MNLAAAVSLAIHRGSLSKETVEQALQDLEEETSLSPEAIAEAGKTVESILTPIHYEEMRSNGTVGLFYAETDVISRALEGGKERLPEENELFTKAVNQDDGFTYVYPQDYRPGERLIV